MTITEFLLERIDDDEWQAKASLGERLPQTADEEQWSAAVAARVLAECAAKRRIVDLYEIHRENRDARRSPLARAAEDEQAAQERRTQEARTRVAEDAARSLAAVYSDHPDYQPEWAV